MLADYQLVVPTRAMVLWVVILLYLASSVVSTVRAWHRLRHFRGPWLASFSQLWLLRHVTSGTMHLDFYDVTRKYGDLARIGPNDLLCSDPDMMRRMLAVRSPYKRSKWYIAMRFDPARENVLSMRDDEEHARMRSIMAPGYSGKDVDNVEAKIDRNILAWVELIERKYLSTETKFRPMEFGRKTAYFTNDTISEISFGKPFGFLAADEDLNGYIHHEETALPIVTIITVFPWINTLAQSSLVRRFLPSPEDQIGLGAIMKATHNIIADRYAPGVNKERDMLGSFMSHGMTKQEAESETIVQVAAGSDTTATAIRATMLHILMTPRIHCRLLAEITAFNPSSPIKDAEARKMPYLQAVIKEGLRIFPPLSGLLAKEVPKGGDTWNGVFIPEGTQVGYCAWGVARNIKVWGDDCHMFRPERWLETKDPEKLRRMESTLELVFGHGKWKCLGKDIAFIELNKIFVELLRRFDFSVVDPIKPWSVLCAGVFFQRDMWLRVTKRSDV